MALIIRTDEKHLPIMTLKLGDASILKVLQESFA